MPFQEGTATAAGGEYVVLLANPVAGGGSATRVAERCLRTFSELGLGAILVTPPGPDKVTDSVREAVEARALRPRALVAVGGDGTVRQGAGAAADLGLALGIVAAGTGNGIAYSLGLPLDQREACGVIASGEPEACDLGLIEFLEPQGGGGRPADKGGRPGPSGGELPGAIGELPGAIGELPGAIGELPGAIGELPGAIGEPPGAASEPAGAAGDESAPPAAQPSLRFVNVAGAGLDAVITGRYKADGAGANPLLRGVPGYAIAALRSLAACEPVPLELELDGNPVLLEALLVAVGNGSFYGKGIRIVPPAEPRDGQLDVCVVSPVNLPDLSALVPLLLLGRHTGHPKVKTFRARHITIRTRPGDVRAVPVHADGDVVGCLPVRVSVIPGAVRVFLREGPPRLSR